MPDSLMRLNTILGQAPVAGAETKDGHVYDFRYGVPRWLLSALGTGPRFSWVRLDEHTLEVRMGWAFRATIERSAITAVRRAPNAYWGIGVHGWAGHWLVNGPPPGSWP